MARAVAKVSACKPLKRSTPMLGSKILHFFFPEFFPVQHTSWIRKTVRRLSAKKRKRKLELTKKWAEAFGSASNPGAAREYAQYVDLMIANLKTTSAAEVGALSRTVVSFSARRNNHAALADILGENLRERLIHFGHVTPTCCGGAEAW